MNTDWLKMHTSVVAMIAMACAAPARAQDPAGAGATAEDSASMPSEGIADIVVTAQRRAESVQKSSLAISVLGQEALQRVVDAKDIATLVPGVQISQGGSTLQTYVRGVGDFGSSSLNQSAVSYNVDGVYVADTSTVSTQFYDLDRVEILKGPQGTLYGRNASAGSVNLNYRRPILGRAGGEVSVEAGNYDYVRGTAAVNIPVGEKVAFRGAFNFIDRDGFLSDGTNDDRQFAVRAQLLFAPSETVSLRIIGDIADREGRGTGSVLISRQAGNGKFTGAINAANNAARLAVSPFAFTPGSGLPPVATTGLLRDTSVNNKQRSISAELNLNLGFADLTFIPAYRSSQSSVATYSSGSPFLNQEDVDQQSYELRLSREGDWGNVIVGAYYLDLDQFTAAQVFTATFITADQFADLGTKSVAGFGQASVNIADGFRAIAGVRYTHEDRSIDASDITNVVDFGSEVTFKKWTWRGGLEYDITPRNMAYVTVSKGFKSGGFNIFAPTPTATNAYQPETLYSYAAGLRNRFFDNKVQFNIEGFYWDYKNSQQNSLAFTPAGDLQFSTFNAASATLYGFDADLVIKPSGNDTLSAAVAFVDTKFDSFILNTPLPNDPLGNTCVSPTNLFVIDCSGRRLPRAPRWSGTASYTHVFDFASGGDVALSGSLDFQSGRSLGINYVANEQVGSYVRFNADAVYTDPEDRFTVTAFIRNITNKEIAIAGNQAGLTPSLIYAQVAPPRTYGIRLGAKF